MAGPVVNNGIKAIIFNAYGTLFDAHSVAYLCDQLFPGKGKELSRLWRIKQLEYTWLFSLLQRYRDFWEITETALRYAGKSLTLSIDQDEMALLMNAYNDLEYFPEVGKALHDLSPYHLSILSNGTPDMLNALVRKNGLTGIFDSIISAHEVRVYKPDARVYRLAERKLKVDPASVLFVSGNSFDINGAKAFGFRGCWVNRRGGQWDSLGFLPDITVGDLRELVEMVKV